MNNPFDDLDGLDDNDSDDSTDDEADGDSGGDPTSGESPPSDETPSNKSGATASGTSSPTGTPDSVGTPDTGDAASQSSSPNGPAFPYDDVKQRPLYAREEAWNAFEDTLELEVERTLREYDVRDATGRELHDAALRVAAEHPEAIANHLLELRGIDVNR